MQADETYAYDANGNRINTGYATGDDNRLTTDGVFNYTYDGEGNLLTRMRISTAFADDYLVAYEYDFHNKLICVTFTNNDATPSITKLVEYEYDVLGNRIVKSVDGDGAGAGQAVETYYLYNNNDVAYEVTHLADSTEVASHVYLQGPAGQILADAAYDYTNSEYVNSWALTDHEGSVRDVVRLDANNVAVVENHIIYGSFGNIVSQTDSTETVGDYYYTGQEFDAETGLYYYNARYYNPTTGRFISQDPMSFAAGDTNLYRYVGNNPMTHTDPTGMCTSTFTGIASSLQYKNTIDIENDLTQFSEKWLTDKMYAFGEENDRLYPQMDRNSSSGDGLFSDMFTSVTGMVQNSFDGLSRMSYELGGMAQGLHTSSSQLMDAILKAGEELTGVSRDTQNYWSNYNFALSDVMQSVGVWSQQEMFGLTYGLTTEGMTSSFLTQVVGKVPVVGAVTSAADSGLNSFYMSYEEKGSFEYNFFKDKRDEARETAATNALYSLAGMAGLNKLTSLETKTTTAIQTNNAVTNNTLKTNSQLVQDIATRAQNWAARKGITGSPNAVGIKQHSYADKLLTRYQDMFGNRGLSTEVRYFDGRLWERGNGLRDTIRLDVVEGNPRNPTAVWDYKFGNATLTPARINEIRTGANLGPNVPVIEVKP